MSALRRAERPLIWAGEELAYTRAHGTLIRLAETLGVPVVTGDGAKDAFPEDHPLSLGTCLGQRIWADNPVHDFTPGCDLVLALGCGFIHRSTVQLGIRLPEQLIQVVADPDYLGRNYPVSLGILADCGAVASQILERVQGLDLSTSPVYRDEIRNLKRLIRAELQSQWPLATRAMEGIRKRAAPGDHHHVGHDGPRQPCQPRLSGLYAQDFPQPLRLGRNRFLLPGGVGR